MLGKKNINFTFFIAILISLFEVKMRCPLVIGNWKLHGSTHMVKELTTRLRNVLSNVAGCNVAIVPPVMYLDQARSALAGSHIALGAQNVDINLSGAFTGDISANMLKDIGAKYIIIGHSERRIYHTEKDAAIAQKFAVLKSVGLIPVLCIGETKRENEEVKTKEVCARQLDAILNPLGVIAMQNSVIAYEPLWAIGTGQSATPLQAQEVHKFIRDHISQYDAHIASELIIQYGGSVNDKNAEALFSQPDIDGALVGGASLKANIFAAIVTAAAKAKM